MPDYIEREALLEIVGKLPLDWEYGKAVSDIYDLIKASPAADVAPVAHGRWVEHGESVDGYYHHKCSNCEADAPYDYKMREDWDEGLDGEWFFLGLTDVGITEHITPYCPNCGAHMKDGE